MYAASTQIPCMYDWLLHYWQISWWVSIDPGLLVTRDTVVITQDVESRWIKNISTNKKYLPYLRCGPLSDWDSCRKPQCATGHGQKRGHCQPSAAEHSRAQPSAAKEPRHRCFPSDRPGSGDHKHRHISYFRHSIWIRSRPQPPGKNAIQNYETFQSDIYECNQNRWMQGFSWVQCILHIHISIYILYIYSYMT